jgi:hypothetical protein
MRNKYRKYWLGPTRYARVRVNNDSYLRFIKEDGRYAYFQRYSVIRNKLNPITQEYVWYTKIRGIAKFLVCQEHSEKRKQKN